MSKAKRIQALLKSGKSVKEVAKATKSSEAYVYYVRWTEKKRGETAPKKANKKAVYKSPRSRLVQDIFQMKKALDVIEPKRVMINLARRKDGAIIDLNKGGEVISPPDLVNHPPHYKAGGIEYWDFAEAKGLTENAYLFNAGKYIVRCGKKEGADPIQDLEKAIKFIQRDINRRKSA